MKYLHSASALVALFSVFDNILAAPLQSPNAPQIVRETLSKRGEPQIPPEFSGPDADRVDNSFSFVLQMASYVVTSPDTVVRPIFEKYFRAEDESKIVAVFNAVLGGDPKDPPGNELLNDIFVQNDDTRNRCSKDASLMSYMDGWELDQPVIQMCKAGLAHKTRDETTCEYLGDHLSYKLNTIGTTLLHEYMHFNKLVRAAAGAQIKDQPNGYGPVNVRKIDKALARTNADSYAYFASEVVWTVLCQIDFKDPRPGIDDADPACADAGCTVDNNPGGGES